MYACVSINGVCMELGPGWNLRCNYGEHWQGIQRGIPTSFSWLAGARYGYLPAVYQVLS